MLLLMLSLASAAVASAAELRSISSSIAEFPHHWPDKQLAVAQGTSAPGGPVSLRGLVLSHPARGGTACQCICGDRVAWHRLIFPGDVEAEKERECQKEVCPNIIIPGLRTLAECTYVEDLSELIAGTICQCQCGDKMAWRNQMFYGNVTGEKETECLEELCPRVNPLPGLRHTAHCRFDPELFSFPSALRPPVPVPSFGISSKGVMGLLMPAFVGLLTWSSWESAL